MNLILLANISYDWQVLLIKGRYILRQDGLVIAESENLLTNNARIAILNNLAGTMGAWASMIAVGAIDAVPAVEDNTLAFEIGRGPVTVRAADIDNNSVLVKATIPKMVEGEIYELGTYSSINQTGDSNSLLLTDFDIEPDDPTGVSLVPLRIGPVGTEISVVASSTRAVTFSGLTIDISAMSDVDTMVLAGSASGMSTVEIRLVNSSGNYLSHSFTPSTRYNAERWSIANFVKVGTGTIQEPFTAIEVLATAGVDGGTLWLDGLRVDEVGTFSEQMLVSRSVISPPIRKGTSSEIEIEYSIEMGF